jgi:hypothetical protein
LDLFIILPPFTLMFAQDVPALESVRHLSGKKSWLKSWLFFRERRGKTGKKRHDEISQLIANARK